MSRRAVSRLLVVGLALGGVGCSSTHHAAFTCSAELRKLTPVTDRGSEPAAGTVIEVQGANAGFTPTCITDVPHGTITLTMRNAGAVVHDIGVAAQHTDSMARPGQSVSIHVRVGDAPVVFECRIHRSLGMVGVLIPASG